jgi:hypothetical protein
VLVIHKTTSELETHDLGHPIICRCRKHLQLAHQYGGFVACCPLNVSMVYSLKLTFVANGNNSTSVELTPGETIWFGSLEFTIDHFSNLSLSLKGNDSGVVFIGMVHSGPPSMHTIHEVSFDEGDAASGSGGELQTP